MADWNGKTFINVSDSNVASNLVRDLFLQRRGEMTVGQWQTIWSNAGAGIMHTSVGHTALVTRELADAVLRRLLEGDDPMCVIENEQRIVWPIQKALSDG